MVSKVEESSEKFKLEYPPTPGARSGVALGFDAVGERFFAGAGGADVCFRAADEEDTFWITSKKLAHDPLSDVGLRFWVRREDLRRVFDAAIKQVSVNDNEKAPVVLGNERVKGGEVLLVALPRPALRRAGEVRRALLEVDSLGRAES